MKDFLSIREHSADELRRILSLGAEVKAKPRDYAKALEGKALAMLFEKPSLRTRVTFDVGIQQMGGYSLYLSPSEVSLGKRESIADVAHNLERMVQCVMIRTFGHHIVEQMAEHSSVPIINGLTDFSHPCQAMADFLTIQEAKGKVEGVKLAYVGDGNNVANSLMFTAARLGTHISVATPPGYEPKPGVLAWMKEHAPASGCLWTVTTDPVEAVRKADVIYTDVWASMGQEAEAEARKKVFLPYQVNEALAAHARPDYVFLHCLPAHRGEEVSAGVIDSPHSMVFQEAENRLHVQKAIMLMLMR